MLDNFYKEQLLAVVEQNSQQNVKEMSQTLSISTATVSHYL